MGGKPASFVLWCLKWAGGVWTFAFTEGSKVFSDHFTSTSFSNYTPCKYIVMCIIGHSPQAQ